MAAQPDRPATGDHVTEKVPARLASAFGTLHGADVSDVPVRRGRAVARQAARLDAAAFSRGGAVYLPDAAGSLDQAAAGALLAHELTHVMQQRMLGSALPSEASPQGQALEEQAVATQRHFLAAAGAVPALALPPGAAPARPTHAPVMRHLQLVPAVSASEPAEIPSASFPVSPAADPGVQRQPVDTAVPMTESGGFLGLSPPMWSSDSSVLRLDGETAEIRIVPASDATIADVHAGIAELRTRIAEIAELADRRHLDLDNALELDELAARLYGRLRSKLRMELIVDRERAGLLTDFP